MKYWILAALLVTLAGCSSGPTPQELDRFQPIQPFQLTASDGTVFDSTAKLDGKVWIADFIYTTCPASCPRMSTWMTYIQGKLDDVKDIRLVSFTVDPVNDTPDVLAAYGKRYKAEPGRWFLLTGKRETLNQLNRYGFKLGNVDESLNHSIRFALVDRTGMVRGYYLSAEAKNVEQLIVDARHLVDEPVSSDRAAR